MHCSKQSRYSITSSARPSRIGGQGKDKRFSRLLAKADGVLHSPDVLNPNQLRR